MTIKIKLSELMSWPTNWVDEGTAREGFAQQVQSYTAVMAEYNAHIEGVRADAANEDLAPEERRVAFPPPSTHPLIERAAAEGYEIVGPSLNEKKAALFAKVRQREADESVKVTPAAKRRHFALRAAAIHKADADLLKIGGVDSKDDVPAFLLANRPPDDTEFLQEQADRAARNLEIERHFAKLEHDIVDLTEETIDSFEIAPFDA